MSTIEEKIAALKPGELLRLPLAYAKSLPMHEKKFSEEDQKKRDQIFPVVDMGPPK